jgi:hypothetical protein
VGFTDYEKDLKNPEVDLELILDKYFHCGESAVFHGAPPDEEPRLKEMVAAAILDTFGVRLHIFQLVVCGSAHLGFSPVPEKLGKPFDAKASDIDMAIASPELFDAWWTELQSAGLDMDTRQVVSRDLFWGFINPANVRHIKGYGSKWWALFGQLKTDRAAGVRGRLFRNFWSMQSYHRIAVAAARNDLLATKPSGKAAV